MNRRTKTVPIQQMDPEPDAAAERRAQSAIERAKARGRQRHQIPGDMEDTPRFDREDARMQPAPGFDRPPPSSLSEETARQLKGLADAQPRREQADDDLEVEEWTEQRVIDLLDVPKGKANRILEILNPSAAKTEEELEKEVVEGRLRPIDIGQFLMNGVVSQTVPIIPDHLMVVYQTIPDELEVFIDAQLAKEAAKIRKDRGDDGMSQREYVRRSNEWALAVHVYAYLGNVWGSGLRSDGTVDEDAMEQKLRSVRALPSPVLPLLSKNLGWFLDRVQSRLNLGVLGNG